MWLSLNFSAHSAAFPLRTLRLEGFVLVRIRRLYRLSAQSKAAEYAEKFKLSHYPETLLRVKCRINRIEQSRVAEWLEQALDRTLFE